MLVGILRSRVGATALLSVCVGLCFAGPARAKPPAPGAPGAIHVWAPADKHGFGTAHQVTSKAWFTLRQGSLSEVYYPDLSTPGFRGLQFAVSDGKGFLQRETVDDDARHIEPLADGVTSRVESVPGSLEFRQITEGTGWRLTKTWITDPARAAVLARVRFESLKGRPLQLYALADPAPGNDGNDDHGISPDTQLVSYDDVAASAVAATPAFVTTTSGYRGTASDPWKDLEADQTLSEYDATAPGNVVQGARTALTGQRGKQDMTLAIGFGAGASSAGATATAALAGGFTAAETAYNAGWAQYRGTLNDAPDSVQSPQLRRIYEQSLLVLAASEDKTYSGASIAAPNMAWIWGTLTLEPERRFSGPYHLVWPRDLYHVATAQKAAGDDEAADRLLDYLWDVQKVDGSWWQNTFVDGKEKWTTEQMDQVSLPIVLAWSLGRDGAEDWSHVERAADYVVANGPSSDNERWENQSGYSPNTIATEIAGLICAAAIARANGEPGKAAHYEALADSWQASVENWTATDNGPYSPKPYYLRITKDAQPNKRHEVRARRQLRRRERRHHGRPARDRRQLVPRAGAVRRQEVERPDGAQLAAGRRRDERVPVEGRHAERAGLAPVHVRRLRGAGQRERLGPVLRQLPAPDARAAVAAAHRRARRVRADRRAQRRLVPRNDREHGERRADAARAGLGRPAPARRAVGQGHALRHAAGVDARPVRAARVVDR